MKEVRTHRNLLDKDVRLSCLKRSPTNIALYGEFAINLLFKKAENTCLLVRPLRILVIVE